MVDAAPEFESIDSLGKTKLYGGTVGVASIQVPPAPGKSIAEIFIRCDIDNTPVTKRLLWSIDDVTYHKLSPGEGLGWTIKKNDANAEITQIYLKGNIAGVVYEVTVNTEEG